ncbi:hypothetical protein BDQ17DRAFT_1306302 [Cyathus striatus]|nr:hypothetical protein BDQ17DRAFT_1306302 [Cyathus striatus]
MMAATPPPTSPSASSSAVTIPIPGKSILKKPPPPPTSLLSRITRFLPSQPLSPSAGSSGHGKDTGEDATKPLKRAHFILPEIAIVYPISSLNPPSTPTLKEEKKAVEEREFERRRKVLRGNGRAGSMRSVGSSGVSVNTGADTEEEWWNMDKVESFYRECCASYDEPPDGAVSIAFKHASPSPPRTVDLSGVQITSTAASILSDVFTIEWGLRRLVCKECDLDEHSIKPLLHALLIPNSLTYLSLSSNKRLKASAFRLVAAFVKKSNTLRFLDLSQNALDKKSVEYLVSALTKAGEPGLESLRLDDCQLRPGSLEVLCRAVRDSSLRNISLRYNRISAASGVALALMIRDYPDVVPASPAPYIPSYPASPAESAPPSPSTPHTPLPPPSAKIGPLAPPPRHPTAAPQMQTTYTPYIPRAKRKVAAAQVTPLSPVPVMISSSQGGVTARHEPAGKHDMGPSAALLDKVRALDSLPRIGSLRTLDLRGNDLKNGITYLTQVLKRNRTLKVLNLSENKLDVQCLVSLAEALKYNSCLETLDLSKNPCSGPGLEGIQSLRTAFTLNTALKRLFLSSTSLTSAGAIALAEFLPESTSLLHLDLTNNNIDLAGVMALSSGLKANHVMRCLDLNIPPADEEFARMCREILNSCVRNTEEAERSTKGGGDGVSVASGRGMGRGVWGLIEESELAKTIKADEEKKVENDVVKRARTALTALNDLIASLSPSALVKDHESSDETVQKAKDVMSEISNVIQETEDPMRLEELLGINDQLLALIKKVPTSKPSLTLSGLGLSFHTDRYANTTAVNGHVNGDTLAVPSEGDTEDEDGTPTTPRIDKGKGRAAPEPEEPEKVLSPTTYLIGEENSEDEEDDPSRYILAHEDIEGVSPTIDRSRSWVEEEGEVFRKGNVLLGPEEMEGEYDGEELRKELLEAMVERPPPRPLTDEFGMEIIPGAGDYESEHNPPSNPTSPTEAVSKPIPRPYISRARSSSSILSVISPAASTSPSPELPFAQSPTVSAAPKSPLSPGASPTILAASPRSYISRKRSVEST